MKNDNNMQVNTQLYVNLISQLDAPGFQLSFLNGPPLSRLLHLALQLRNLFRSSSSSLIVTQLHFLLTVHPRFALLLKQALINLVLRLQGS